MSNKANPGDVVELAVKDGGFFDSETGFKIVNGQQVKLGDVIGNKTNQALLSGGLLVVSEANIKGSDESDLPQGFPGRDVFVAAGMNLQAVKDFDFANNKVPGIGKATIDALKKFFDEEAKAK